LSNLSTAIVSEERKTSSIGEKQSFRRQKRGVIKSSNEISCNMSDIEVVLTDSNIVMPQNYSLVNLLSQKHLVKPTSASTDFRNGNPRFKIKSERSTNNLHNRN
jgi:hypothetical protein